MRERILLVDDEKPFCLTLKKALEKKGYQVEAAFDGKSAIEIAQRGTFDLMVVDVRMPDITGLDALKAVKEFQPRIEGIVVTGYASYEAPVNAIKLGVRDYLGKPFDLDEFIGSIERVLAQARATTQRARAAQKTRKGYLESLKFLAAEWEGADGPGPRIAGLARQLARQCGWGAEKARELSDLAWLTRLGRRTSLAAADWDVGRAHMLALRQVLDPVEEFHSFLPTLLAIYERADGSGFPEELKAEDIPLGARLLTAATVFVEDGLERARALSGSMLDPEVVKLLEASEDVAADDEPEAGSLEDRYAAVMRLAAACQQADDHATAQSALDEASRLAKQIGDRELQAACEMRRAFLFQQRGDPQAAQQAAAAAWQAAQSAGGTRLAEIQGDLGRLRRAWGDREGAEDVLLSALISFERWQWHYQAASAALALASLYVGWKDASVEKYLGRAIEITSSHGLEDMFLWEWESAAPVLKAMAHREDARALLERYGPPQAAHTAESVEPAVPQIRICLLGEIVVWRGAERVKEEAYHGRKVKLLLAYLLLHHGRFVQAEQIQDLFWPDSDEEKAHHNLHMTVHRLRKAIEPDVKGHGEFIIQQSDSYAFNVEAPAWIDLHAFESRFMEGRQHQASNHAAAAVAAFVEAERLYAGDFVETAPYEDWCMEPRDALKRKYQDVLGFIAQTHMAGNQLDMAEEYCRKLLACDPTREEVWRMVMRIMWQRGMRDEAIKAWQACCRVLKEELAVEPLPETRALYLQITAGLASASTRA
ncbi:MAG: response regulator [Candidatus Xenobia bacterium]